MLEKATVARVENYAEVPSHGRSQGFKSLHLHRYSMLLETIDQSIIEARQEMRIDIIVT
jgi:hypothetical protein